MLLIAILHYKVSYISLQTQTIHTFGFQLQKDLHEMQKQELEMKEDLEGLKGRLRSEKNYLEEIICERDKLRNLCDEKDSAIQVAFLKRMCSILTRVCIFSSSDCL